MVPFLLRYQNRELPASSSLGADSLLSLRPSLSLSPCLVLLLLSQKAAWRAESPCALYY